MLDIKRIREDPAAVRVNLARRQDEIVLAEFDELVAKDIEWRRLKGENDALRAKRNAISEEINSAKKAGRDVSDLISQAKLFPVQIKENDAVVAALESRIRELLMRIPNVLHSSVPFGKDSSENVVVKTVGKPRKRTFEVVHHGELAARLGLADFENAVKVAGSGFFYLLGDLALLDMALQRYALDLLMKKGFVPVQPPLVLRRDSYETMVSLSNFEDVMYPISDSDQYLIATSEHPMGARFREHLFAQDELPLRFAGVSACFRREIGKHGLDERGFFRVHQFNKVEQFVVCRPKDADKLFRELVSNAETLLKSLEIPFRTVNVCTGDIGIIAARKFDIEGWSPRENKYFELMSASDCTNYQAHRLNARFMNAATHQREFVFTLNNTMLATTRFLRAFIENHQTSRGTIKIPKPLWKYMNNKKEIGLVLHAKSKKKSDAQNRKKPKNSV